MSHSALLAPVFVQVLLTFVLGTWLGIARLGAVSSGKTRIKDIALGQPAWPDKVQQVSNSYANQFEMPVLFYALVALLMITGKGDIMMVVLAWGFVVTRAAHAAIHTTTNVVRQRFRSFLAGTILLGVMWIIFGVRVLADGS